jgi:hypothetical protein
MLQRIAGAAEFSVARGCGFALVAMSTFMVGLAADMRLAMQAGGYMALITCMVLILKAWYVDHQPYKKTELWLLLDPADRPTEATAQQIISTVLREAYLKFALLAASLAAGLLIGSVMMGFLPSRGGLG